MFSRDYQRRLHSEMARSNRRGSAITRSKISHHPNSNASVRVDGRNPRSYSISSGVHRHLRSHIRIEHLSSDESQKRHRGKFEHGHRLTCSRHITSDGNQSTIRSLRRFGIVAQRHPDSHCRPNDFGVDNVNYYIISVQMQHE